MKIIRKITLRKGSKVQSLLRHLEINICCFSRRCLYPNPSGEEFIAGIRIMSSNEYVRKPAWFFLKTASPPVSENRQQQNGHFRVTSLSAMVFVYPAT